MTAPRSSSEHDQVSAESALVQFVRRMSGRRCTSQSSSQFLTGVLPGEMTKFTEFRHGKSATCDMPVTNNLPSANRIDYVCMTSDRPFNLDPDRPDRGSKVCIRTTDRREVDPTGKSSGARDVPREVLRIIHLHCVKHISVPANIRR